MRVAAVSGAAVRSLAVLGARQSRVRLHTPAIHVAFLNSLSGASTSSAGRGTNFDGKKSVRCSTTISSRVAAHATATGTRRRSRSPTSRSASVSALKTDRLQLRPMSASSSATGLDNTGGVSNDAAAGLCAEVIPVPILSDNYAYLLIDPQTGKTACIDPAEPDKVLAAAKARGVEITTLLCTHKHWDHSGGNEAMKEMIPGLEVVSSAYEDDVPAMTLALNDQEEYKLGSLNVKALHTPCHTRGHVVYFVTGSGKEGGDESAAAPLVFSGDTLFVGGCGRFFEGDASQMSKALQGVAASLPAETRVFCGHEYTVSNLQFAKSVEPESKAVLDKLDWSRRILAAGGYTVPSTIAQELQHNPFMRVEEKAVLMATGAGDGVDAMKRLREMKNKFRPPPETPGRFPGL